MTLKLNFYRCNFSIMHEDFHKEFDACDHSLPRYGPYLSKILVKFSKILTPFVKIQFIWMAYEILLDSSSLIWVNGSNKIQDIESNKGYKNILTKYVVV